MRMRRAPSEAAEESGLVRAGEKPPCFRLRDPLVREHEGRDGIRQKLREVTPDRGLGERVTVIFENRGLRSGERVTIGADVRDDALSEFLRIGGGDVDLVALDGASHAPVGSLEEPANEASDEPPLAQRK